MINLKKRGMQIKGAADAQSEKSVKLPKTPEIKDTVKAGPDALADQNQPVGMTQTTAPSPAQPISVPGAAAQPSTMPNVPGSAATPVPMPLKPVGVVPGAPQIDATKPVSGLGKLGQLIKRATQGEGLSAGMTLETIAKKHNVSMDYIKGQMEKGIAVEYEHTNDKAVAKKIAMDHLTERADYYIELAKMEKGGMFHMPKVQDSTPYTRLEDFSITPSREWDFRDLVKLNPYQQPSVPAPTVSQPTTQQQPSVPAKPVSTYNPSVYNQIGRIMARERQAEQSGLERYRKYETNKLPEQRPVRGVASVSYGKSPHTGRNTGIRVGTGTGQMYDVLRPGQGESLYTYSAPQGQPLFQGALAQSRIARTPDIGSSLFNKVGSIIKAANKPIKAIGSQLRTAGKGLANAGSKVKDTVMQKLKQSGIIPQILKKTAMYAKDPNSIYSKMWSNPETYGAAGGMNLSEQGYLDGPYIPKAYTADQIYRDPYLDPVAKAKSLAIIGNASDSSHGLISPKSIARAAVGIGIGYQAGKLFGDVVGGVFGNMTPQLQKRLTNAGMVAGLLKGTGAL